MGIEISIVFILGIPNSGKTTISNNFSNVIHIDNIIDKRTEIINIIIKMCKENSGVVIDGLFPYSCERKYILDNIQGKKICYYLKTPLETCIERENNYRKRPISMIKYYSKVFEEPEYQEGWDKIIIVEEGKMYVRN